MHPDICIGRQGRAAAAATVAAFAVAIAAARVAAVLQEPVCPNGSLQRGLHKCSQCCHAALLLTLGHELLADEPTTQRSTA